MSAPVTVIRRRKAGTRAVWGWEITPHEGMYAGQPVILAGQTQLSDARFVTSTQTKLEGKLEHGQLDMAGAVRVEKRGMRHHRVDTGELVTKAQGVWLSPMGNIFAVGLE